MDSSGWAVPDHNVHTNTADDDFQQFLDMNSMNGLGGLTDGLNYDFQGFQSAAGTQLMQVPAREQLDTPMTGSDAPMLLSPSMPSMQQQQQHQLPTITTSSAYQSIPTTMMPPPTPSESIVNSLDAQIHFLQQQKMQAQQRQIEEQVAFFTQQQQRRMVPPTPQSLEIPPGNNPFYAQPSASDQHHQQQQHQAAEYRYQRAKEQSDACLSPYPGSGSRFADGVQMSFTPLVSPAVTPLDTHFSVESQFTVPGAYFSPLTSPALHAQADPLAVFEQRHGSITTSSPREMDLDAVLPAPPTAAPGDLAKKVRKNAAKARTKAGGVKQSPISKPLRKRTATTPALNAQALNELMENVEQSQDYQALPTPMIPNSSASTTTTGPTDSEDGSVSPEALNNTTPIEVEMPPPPIPKPKSAKPSPFLAPQSGGAHSALQPLRPGIASPATPASLMKLSSPNTPSTETEAGSQELVDEHIEVFELPESINPGAAPPGTNDTPTPTQPPKESAPSKTPALMPLPSPSLGRPADTASATQSPQITPGSGYATKKTPQLLPRGSKKRGSVSSIPVSPALRPKISISPNMKPLLPGGPDVEESASHLLATKSNYQRILEGNTVPGVSYPSELSTNLTSKRTSHKIAEQGRRNRINTALQEIATLLPKAPRDSEGEGSDGRKEKEKEKEKERSGGGVPNSKASTVEMAIEYIKQLQQEVAEANKRAEEAEKKLVGLRAADEDDSMK
ncbi:helix-loop-helix DNA-binding domain-containing protein [Podospora australis]|uniref:Helix-loop-helix DNA-binding domain-containing protein n=1 Tax=Podospora australis TaxID=1536484 RepID=A0AAN7AJ36_9PEZI|nr:helix-loop-helix DNA-binding domain-containing protein [Podospora australis]